MGAGSSAVHVPNVSHGSIVRSMIDCAVAPFERVRCQDLTGSHGLPALAD
jgi:hypothetical protein